MAEVERVDEHGAALRSHGFWHAPVVGYRGSSPAEGMTLGLTAPVQAGAVSCRWAARVSCHINEGL